MEQPSKLPRVFRLQIIKDCLTSSTVLSQERSPLAFIVIQAHKMLSGWKILEHLLCSRLISCGAEPDMTLDTQLVNLTFASGESYTGFYLRVQQLLHEFILQSILSFSQ